MKEIRPKTARALKVEQEKLINVIREGMINHDMLLVVSRLSEDKKATQVVASSMFKGGTEDMLHLLNGLKNGTNQIVEESIEQMPEGLKELFHQVSGSSHAGREHREGGMPHSSLDDEHLDGYL